jgi:hypothetical protein
VEPPEFTTPSQHPNLDLQVEVNYGSFNKWNEVERDARTSTLYLDFANGGCEIRLYMKWDIEFFEDIAPYWLEHKNLFPPISFRKRVWGSGETISGEVTMDTSRQYGELFYARLAKDILAYFFTVGEQTVDIPTEGTILWDEDVPYGSTVFIK